MVVFRNKNGHFGQFIVNVQAPFHSVFQGKFLLKMRFKARKVNSIFGELTNDSHKKNVGGFVDMLVQINNVSLKSVYKAGNGTNDSGLIRTMNKNGGFQ